VHDLAQRFARIAIVTSALIIGCPPAVGHAEDRDSVLAAGFAATAPLLDPSAPAEVLTWDAKVTFLLETDQVWTVVAHRLVTRVFSEAGGDAAGSLTLSYDEGARIEGVTGSTISPDGSKVPLRPKDVHDRDLARQGKRRTSIKTIVLPAVVPGSIVEVRWTEKRPHSSWIQDVFPLQRELPVHRATVRLTPLSVAGVPGFRWLLQNTDATTEWDRGTLVVTARNVPAHHDEPDAPPAASMMPRLLAYYADLSSGSMDEVWSELGRLLHTRDVRALRSSKPLESAAREAIGGEIDPARQAARLAAYCRDRVRNVDRWDVPGADDLRIVAKQERPLDCLRAGVGTGSQINRLFAALAIAAGLDARVAYASSRSDGPFDARSPQVFALHHVLVAVRLGGTWQLFDPGQPGLPADMLSWEQESTPVLLPDASHPTFILAPASRAARSCRTRVADLRLLPDGGLEGEVRIEFTGHVAATVRMIAGRSEGERAEWLRERVRQELHDAAIEQPGFAGVEDPESTIVARYRLRVPAYAQVSVMRLFVQPAFQHEAGPRYAAATRQYPLWFQHAWSEIDSIRIELPPGAVPVGPQSELKIPFGAFGEYVAGLVHGDGWLGFRRHLRLERTQFEREAYPAVKATFDRVAEFDGSTVEFLTSGTAP